jgi:hypothetical protein
MNSDSRNQPIVALTSLREGTEVTGGTEDNRFQIRLYLEADSLPAPPVIIGQYDTVSGVFKLFDGFKGWIYIIPIETAPG